MHSKVEFKQVRNSNEVVDDSILFIKQNWKLLLKVYLTICGFFWAGTLITHIVSSIQDTQHVNEVPTLFGISFFVGQAFSFLNIALTTLTVLCFISLYKDKGNEAPTVEEVWVYVKFYFFRVLGCALVLWIGLIIATLFCVIPGIYLLPVFAIILPVMIMENTTFGYAFSRGFELARNNWGTAFAPIVITSIIVLAAFMLVAIPTMAISGGVVLLTGQSFDNTYRIILTFIADALQFLYILPIITVTMTYFNLSKRLDGAGLMDRIQLLGKSSTDTHQLPSEEY